MPHQPEPSPPAETPSEEPLETVVARVRSGSRYVSPFTWPRVGFTPADLRRLLEAAEENGRLRAEIAQLNQALDTIYGGKKETPRG